MKTGVEEGKKDGDKGGTNYINLANKKIGLRKRNVDEQTADEELEVSEIEQTEAGSN